MQSEVAGAAGLDASLLSGKQLLNLDSEEEGILTVGCAGGADTEYGSRREVAEQRDEREEGRDVALRPQPGPAASQLPAQPAGPGE